MDGEFDHNYDNRDDYNNSHYIIFKMDPRVLEWICFGLRGDG